MGPLQCLFAGIIITRRCGVEGVYLPWGKGLTMLLFNKKIMDYVLTTLGFKLSMLNFALTAILRLYYIYIIF